jgi:hypothetical protein
MLAVNICILLPPIASSVVAGTVTVNGVALATKGLGPRHLGVTCMTHASPIVFGHPTIPLSMMVKPIPASV